MPRPAALEVERCGPLHAEEETRAALGLRSMPVRQLTQLWIVRDEQDMNSLPLVRAPPDALRYGFYSASEDARPVHEVQRLQTMVRGALLVALESGGRLTDRCSSSTAATTGR